MGDQQVIQVLRAYSDYLHVSNLVSDGLRYIGNLIILGFASLTNVVSDSFRSMYKLLNFWEYSGVKNFLRTYNAAIWALATVAIAWAGLMFIHNKRVDYQEKGNNFLVALLLFFGTTFFMTQATNMVNSGISSKSVDSPVVVSLYKSYITDVYSLDAAGWKHTGTKATLPNVNKQNSINDMGDVKLLNINEKVDTGHWYGGSQVSPDGSTILTRQLSKNHNGKWELHNMTGMFKLDDHYYRYSWSPWYLFFSIACVFSVTLITIFKVIKIEMEIGFIGLLTQGIALTDIDSGKRNRQLITKLRDSFVVLFLLDVLIQFYSLFLGYLNHAGLTPGTKILAMIGAALFIIDGPNIIQAIFGIDAGVASMAQSMTNVLFASRGLGALGRGAGNLAKGVAKTAGKVAKGGLVAGAGAVGAGEGLLSKPKLPAAPVPAAPGKDAVGGGEEPELGAQSGVSEDAPKMPASSGGADTPAASPSGKQLGAMPFHPPLAGGKGIAAKPSSASAAALQALKDGHGTAPGLPGKGDGLKAPKVTAASMPGTAGKEARSTMAALQQDQPQAAMQKTLGQRAQAKLMATPTVQATHRVYRLGENSGALMREDTERITGQSVGHVLDDHPKISSNNDGKE
ncbi:pLS20_p028 family conjugation system transmembrane protein [Lacticaseibacillus suibinensis]|uniref:pLS20_p028 family conjugation system transmembrane protein n=1 Tax=Lacticaseibacillus suibinensis TaxID=2486011 RepID=UPI0019444435|nr:hypothetical protein [Lacticaseibacillus suibinensis]